MARKKNCANCSSRALQSTIVRDAMLAMAEEENQRVWCTDDITCKELQWSEKFAKLKNNNRSICATPTCMGKLMHVMQSQSISHHRRHEVDRHKQSIRGEPLQFRSRLVSRQLKRGDRPDLYAMTAPLEAVRAIISIAANHKQTFSIMHLDVSRACVHARGVTRVFTQAQQGD